MNNMNFNELFKMISGDWPKIIEFGALEYYDTPDGGSGYSIENLKYFPDILEKKYDGNSLKVLLDNLNYSIYNLLGYSARDFNKVRIQDLRIKTIKKNFEHILEDILDNQNNESDWSKESIETVKEYFRVNYPDVK